MIHLYQMSRIQESIRHMKYINVCLDIKGLEAWGMTTMECGTSFTDNENA